MPESIASVEVREALRSAARASRVDVRVNGATVNVATPFASPSDWRDQWIYFLLVDRFDNPVAAPKAAPFNGDHDIFQGGSLEGIRRRLPYLAGLGVGALWLSPVFKNCQFEESTYHGYGFQDLLAIEPRFTRDPAAARADPRLADQELRQLVDEAHAHGLYVIFDVVLNHAGNVFDYDGHGAAAPFRAERYSIRWRNESGAPAFRDLNGSAGPLHPDAGVWPRELQRNELFRAQGKGGEAGGDFESLKELITDFREGTEFGARRVVQNTLISAYQYLIARFDVDGFRIDTLKYVEAEFARTFGNAMREFALSIGKKDFFTFGEVFDDEAKIAQFIGRDAVLTSEPIGVDAALDFPLFFRLPAVLKGFSAPSELAGLYAERRRVQRGLVTSHGEASGHFVTFLDNHDMRERFYFDDGSGKFDDQATLAFGALFCLQGIPCLYYGTEQGLSGRGGVDRAVREALWGKANAFDPNHPFCVTIRQLAALRAGQAALRYGRQYFRQVSGNGTDFGISPFAPGVVAFSRILNDQEVVVVANVAGQPFRGAVLVDAALNPDGSPYSILFSNQPNPTPPGVVQTKPRGSVRIFEEGGAQSDGPARVVPVDLRGTEIQILRRT